jgi:unsaturated rhamnogalacturonyl hydrolase
MYNDDNNWHNATFHSGNMALYRRTADSTYLNFTLAWATKHDFSLISSKTTPYFPDYETAGQVYLDLYEHTPNPAYLKPTLARIAAQVASGQTNTWNYVDALHMAGPVFARLGVLEKQPTSLSRMHTLFEYTLDSDGGHGLFDTKKHLWWRDSSFVGSNTYWSRGVGWAVAAMAKVLGAIPTTTTGRADYVKNLTEVAAALVPLQRSDGFWNADLTQPTVDDGIETSGTALHIFGIAWAINNGILDAATYRPVVEKAWTGLTTKALHSSGLLGWVQGPGSKPSDHYPWSSTDTQPYGVGAFLLAGDQIATMLA